MQEMKKVENKKVGKKYEVRKRKKLEKQEI